MSRKKYEFTRVVSVRFFRSGNGSEPVRNWIKSLTKKQKKVIGEDLKTIEASWPIGMPLVRPLGKKLWEVRSSFQGGIARIIFVIRDSEVILLNGFIKKTQKTPLKEIELALRRAKQLEEDG